jgi:hypothetical protein
VRLEAAAVFHASLRARPFGVEVDADAFARDPAARPAQPAEVHRPCLHARSVAAAVTEHDAADLDALPLAVVRHTGARLQAALRAAVEAAGVAAAVLAYALVPLSAAAPTLQRSGPAGLGQDARYQDRRRASPTHVHRTEVRANLPRRPGFRSRVAGECARGGRAIATRARRGQQQDPQPATSEPRPAEPQEGVARDRT